MLWSLIGIFSRHNMALHSAHADVLEQVFSLFLKMYNRYSTLRLRYFAFVVCSSWLDSSYAWYKLTVDLLKPKLYPDVGFEVKIASTKSFEQGKLEIILAAETLGPFQPCLYYYSFCLWSPSAVLLEVSSQNFQLTEAERIAFEPESFKQRIHAWQCLFCG